MGAENERGLQEKLVHRAGAAAIQVEEIAGLRGALRVLVGQAEAQELRGPERDVRLDRPFHAGVLRELRPVISHTAGHPAPRLHLAAEVPAPAVLVPPFDRVGHAVAVGVGLDVELADREERLARHRDEGMKPAVRPVLVASFPAEDRAGAILGGLAASDRHAELERMIRTEFQEGAEPPGEEGILERSAAECRLVVAVEDAAERLNVERQVGHERGFESFFDESFVAQEIAHDVRTVDPRQIMLVNLVGPAKAVANLTHSELGSEWERQERQVRLGQVDGDVAAARLLAGLDSHDRRGVRVDLAEERELDLAREEPVLETGEASAPGLLDVALGELADEVAGDADIEQELAGTALLVEAEGLARPRDVESRDARLLSGLLGCRGRGTGRRRDPGRGCRRLSLETLESIGHRLELLLQLFDLFSQCRGLVRRRSLGGRSRRRQRDQRQDEYQCQSTHRDPPATKWNDPDL